SVGPPAEHTAGATEFDLSPVRAAIDERPLREVAEEAADVAGKYLASAGFVEAGELQPLGPEYVAAAELRRVGRTAGRLRALTDEEEAYLLALLRDADRGERPAPGAVPETFHPERGLAVAASIDAYLADLRRVLEPEGQLARVISELQTQQKRIEALDGNVDPATAEPVLDAAQQLSDAVDGDETALKRAATALDDAGP
ncbi:hypothetical protein BRC62_04520, partial [Halobacteriales archaeon QH_10_67_13]